MRRISFDTETTGLDLRHGAKPFFVTVCDLDTGATGWWEWEVDPLTREVQVVPSELDEITKLINSVELLVLHNAKFDATAMQSIVPGLVWPWHKTVDTLVAAHLLGSNEKKDLGALALRWLKQDISRYEKSIVKAANEARSLARREHKDFLIAKEGLPCMPSAKAEVSRMDYWLPRALAGHLEHEEGHPWHTVLRDYANVDSAVTARLWPIMEAEIKRRGQWKIFEAQNELTESIIEMENRGVTMSLEGVERRKSSRQRESEIQGRRCRNIARMKGHDLELPKGGVNDSMRHFVFEVLKLEGVANRKAKTDKPTLNSAALEKYAKEAEPRSLESVFFRSLLGKKDADTEVTYLEAYNRFQMKVNGVPGWGRLHPNFNGTGTDTLRFSCSQPNSQNVKKPDEDDPEGTSVRSCFGPAPGREWWSCDAKNIELRIPAYASGEKDQIAIFENPNDPPYYGSMHLLNFSAVYPDIWQQVLDEVGFEKVGPTCKKRFASSWYQWCKNGAFARQYGGGKRTVDGSFRRHGAYELLGNRFSKLEALNQRCIRDAKTKGVIETLPDRSVDQERGYPLLCGRTETGGVLTTTPLNYFSSGSAMWWMRRAMLRTHAKLKEWRVEGFDGFMVIQVHDEICLDFPFSPNHGNRWRVRVLQDLMEQGGTDIGVPVPVSCTYHPVNWGEGETL